MALFHSFIGISSYLSLFVIANESSIQSKFLCSNNGFDRTVNYILPMSQ